MAVGGTEGGAAWRGLGEELDLVVGRAEQLPHASLTDQLVQLLIVFQVRVDHGLGFHVADLGVLAVIARQAILLEGILPNGLNVFSQGLLVP